MKKIINTLIIVGYIWLALSLIFQTALPIEIKDKLPFINSWSFVFTGLSTGAISTILLYVKNFTRNSEASNLGIIIDITDRLLKLDDLINNQDKNILKQNENLLKLEQSKLIDNENNLKLIEQNNEIIRLQKVELESRLTNPLIDENIKAKIKAVLGDEK